MDKRLIYVSLTVFAVVATSLCGCHRDRPRASGPLPQRGYLWQRDWTPAVTDAAAEADRRMDGLVLLGAEIVWQGGKARVVEANIPWDAVRALKKRCAIALRVAPFTRAFAADDATERAVATEVRSLLAAAKTHGVELAEFQLDFDCAQRKLAGYRTWLRALRPLVPGRFVITALPAWLDEVEFANLAREVDGYVLQVHSVPTAQETGHADLCDPALARKWVTKAAALGMPFSVALPTYRCLAGYDASGKLLGVVMDSVQQAWPPGTRALEFATDADEVSALVKEWQVERPQGLRELLWYRVPVATDVLNWRWPTLSAVMAGRKPEHKLEAIHEGENPVDLSLANRGEADELLDRDVRVTWNGAPPAASDALKGWTVRAEKGLAVFTPQPGFRAVLPPGGQRGIGWLRYGQFPVDLRLQVSEHDENKR